MGYVTEKGTASELIANIEKKGRKNMKKLALFLALCLLVSSIGLAAFAEDPVVPGDN